MELLRVGLAMFLMLALPLVGAILLYLAYLRFRLATNLRPFAWLRARLGWGLPVSELARRLGIGVDELLSHRPDYAETFIAKRSGGRRRLLIPDRTTKQLQRRLLRRVLSRLHAHPAACGFERGRSIVDNARPHVGRAIVLRMDIVDFFTTTQAERLERYFRRIGWNREAAAVLVRLTTHEGGLPQGAPTSPRLSNLVNYFLDVQLTNLAARRVGTYTRYADDITFSFPMDYPKKMRGIVQLASRMLKAHGYRAHQRKKLSIRRRHQRQIVTGLVVNDRIQLPRSTRRNLRAVQHRLRTGRPASLTPAQLDGWLALMHMIDRQAGTKKSPTDREPRQSSDRGSTADSSPA
jgi:retron-type reverse transcriptase